MFEQPLLNEVLGHQPTLMLAWRDFIKVELFLIARLEHQSSEEKTHRVREKYDFFGELAQVEVDCGQNDVLSFSWYFTHRWRQVRMDTMLLDLVQLKKRLVHLSLLGIQDFLGRLFNLILVQFFES